MVAKFYCKFVRACKFGKSSVILLFRGFIMYNCSFFLCFSYSSNCLYQCRLDWAITQTKSVLKISEFSFEDMTYKYFILVVKYILNLWIWTG